MFSFRGVLGTGTAIAVVLAVMLSDCFDTMGTVVGIAGEADMAIQVLLGHWRWIHPLMYIVAAVFAWYFAKGLLI